MIDAADLAILETHIDAMNPVERGLLEEVRRLKDEAGDVATLEGKVLELEEELDDTKSELDDAQEEIKRLENALATSEQHALESDRGKERALEELADLKREFRALLKIPSWVEEAVT